MENSSEKTVLVDLQDFLRERFFKKFPKATVENTNSLLSTTLRFFKVLPEAADYSIQFSQIVQKYPKYDVYPYFFPNDDNSYVFLATPKKEIVNLDGGAHKQGCCVTLLTINENPEDVWISTDKYDKNKENKLSRMY